MHRLIALWMKFDTLMRDDKFEEALLLLTIIERYTAVGYDDPEMEQNNDKT